MNLRAIIVRRMTELGLSRDQLALYSGASRSAVYTFLPAKPSTKSASVKIEHLEKMLTYLRLDLVDLDHPILHRADPTDMVSIIRKHLTKWRDELDTTLAETKSGRRHLRSRAFSEVRNSQPDGSGRTVLGRNVYLEAWMDWRRRNPDKMHHDRTFSREFEAEIWRVLRMSRLRQRTAKMGLDTHWRLDAVSS